MTWIKVHYPIESSDQLPPERQIVAVWCEADPAKDRGGKGMPYCGYLRYAAGDINSPFFVVYHGNNDRSVRVVAWCDCLPKVAPDGIADDMYNRDQVNGRGFPARA